MERGLSDEQVRDTEDAFRRLREERDAERSVRSGEGAEPVLETVPVTSDDD